MTRHHESVSAALHEGGLVQIHLTRLERGVDVGGKLWLSLDAAPWVIEAVSKCIEDLTSSETTIGRDTLRVKEKGHELDPQVGIGNERTGPVPHAGRYFLVMGEAPAQSLIEQLRALSK